MTPQTAVNDGAKEIRIERAIFDLDSKADVEVVKVGTFTPVKDMSEFVARLGNDSAKILEIVNDGLEEFSRKQLIADSATPWQQKDDEGNLTPFSGSPIAEDREKAFAASVLNIAKMMFGYPDVPRGTKLDAATVKANREKKLAAKQSAVDMLLSNPAAVEALKG